MMEDLELENELQIAEMTGRNLKPQWIMVFNMSGRLCYKSIYMKSWQM